jgi:hypothetical protein
MIREFTRARTIQDRVFRGVLAVWLIVAAPRAALACPVCFGNSDSPLAVATNMGIIAMLVVVAGMIGAFATFFIYLNRRAKRVAAQEGTV